MVPIFWATLHISEYRSQVVAALT